MNAKEMKQLAVVRMTIALRKGTLNEWLTACEILDEMNAPESISAKSVLAAAKKQIKLYY